MRIVAPLILGILTFILLWIGFIPTMAWGFFGWITVTLLALIVAAVTEAIMGQYDDDGPKVWFSTTFLFALIFGVILPLSTTWSAFHAERYRALLGTVEEKEVNSVMSPISPENVAIVDPETAHRLADKSLGLSEKMIGSQVDVGPLELQKVGHKLYYVAPLLHSGFWKWMSNGDVGTNGYVMVSATDERDVRLVQQINDKPVRIVYQPEAYMGQDLERHVYFNGHKSIGMTEFSFEIDDAGKPYYVISLYENTIGFAGSNVTGICLVDVETGEMKDYTIADAPKWVDRIEPHDFVDTQIDDWGYLVHGWWNPNNNERVKATEGGSLVYGDDGNCYFYIGIQSVGNNQSSIGFMMINSRTKHAIYYKQAGATEVAAMSSAQGKVSEKRYQAAYPRPYNIDGKWTYVMALKDEAGLIKGVAMVSVQEYTIVGVGDDVKSAMRAYKSAWNGTGNAVSFTPQASTFSFDGVVDRFTADVRGGNTYYYFTVRDEPQKAFVVTSSVSEEAALTRGGDRVHLAFDDGGHSFIDVQFFDNMDLTPQKTDGQRGVEDYFKTVLVRSDSLSDVRDERTMRTNDSIVQPTQPLIAK